MKFLDWLAAVVLWFELPIPLFWLVMHPLVGYWRTRQRAAYTVALLAAWGAVTAYLMALHARLFASERVPSASIVVGIALLVLDVYLFRRAQRDLGKWRLVGKLELSGGGELATEGIYARMRHPRYAGMMIAVLGACLLAGSRWLWLTAAAWGLLALLAIRLEERELRARFGAAYESYCRRVPQFVPIRFRLREP
jgi:protein-S-isoprenylcysteine O-methyltransferase Ste14